MASRLMINILLKSENSNEDSSCQDEYIQGFEQRSMIARLVPTLRFEFKNIEQLAEILLRSVVNQESFGFVLTSPRVVEAVSQALSALNTDQRASVRNQFKSDLIFPVATKTAETWKKKTMLDYNHGATESGDGSNLSKYIAEYCRNSDYTNIKLVYPKGSLANQTIEDELATIECLTIESIEVYDTKSVENLDQAIISCFDSLMEEYEFDKYHVGLCVNFIFFSPSGVRNFERHFNSIQKRLTTGRQPIEIVFSSIGHTTEKSLKDNGFEVFSVSQEPSAGSLIECIEAKIKTRYDSLTVKLQDKNN